MEYQVLSLIVIVVFLEATPQVAVAAKHTIKRSLGLSAIAIQSNYLSLVEANVGLESALCPFPDSQIFGRHGFLLPILK
jgi:hypothetical protein